MMPRRIGRDNFPRPSALNFKAPIGPGIPSRLSVFAVISKRCRRFTDDEICEGDFPFERRRISEIHGESFLRSAKFSRSHSALDHHDRKSWVFRPAGGDFTRPVCPMLRRARSKDRRWWYSKICVPSCNAECRRETLLRQENFRAFE